MDTLSVNIAPNGAVWVWGETIKRGFDLGLGVIVSDGTITFKRIRSEYWAWPKVVVRKSLPEGVISVNPFGHISACGNDDMRKLLEGGDCAWDLSAQLVLEVLQHTTAYVFLELNWKDLLEGLPESHPASKRMRELRGQAEKVFVPKLPERLPVKPSYKNTFRSALQSTRREKLRWRKTEAKKIALAVQKEWKAKAKDHQVAMAAVSSADLERARILEEASMVTRSGWTKVCEHFSPGSSCPFPMSGRGQLLAENSPATWSYGNRPYTTEEPELECQRSILSEAMEVFMSAL